MRSLFANRYVDALAKTILCFGAIHLIILAVEAIRVKVFVLNAFKILNLDLLIPGLGAGLVNLVLSYGVVLAVYGLAYKFLTERRSRAKA